jgi:hypothetical protein
MRGGRNGWVEGEKDGKSEGGMCRRRGIDGGIDMLRANWQTGGI